MSLDENSTKIADILAKANAFEQVHEKWRAKIEIVMRRKLQSNKAPFAIELFAYIFLSIERNQGAFLMPKMAILSKEAVM